MKDSHPANWRTHRFWAMGSQVALWLETSDSGAANAAFTAAEALFAANEQILSRFQPTSELSKLNARAGQWTTVSARLWNVLALAIRMAEITNGCFDPTILNALERCGYTDSFEKLTPDSQNERPAISVTFRGRNYSPHRRKERKGKEENFAVAASFAVKSQRDCRVTRGQWAAVRLDKRLKAVCLPPGIRVDLGGIAKGYTAQQAVELMRPFGPCLVDAGGDLAAGDSPQGYPGWPVAVSSPWPGADHETTDLYTAWLANRSLATSGIDYRTWQRNGQTCHHLINPVTGLPADTGGLTVTILADEAATAEAWATATLASGPATGMAALLDADLAGLMVLKNGQILVTPAMQRHIQDGQLHRTESGAIDDDNDKFHLHET